MSGSILFNTIPVNNLRVPGTNIEIDPQGGTGQQLFSVLIIGQITGSGLATPNVPLQCAGVGDPNIQCGVGSMLAMMVNRYIQQDTFGPVWYLPLADDSGASFATLTWTYTGTATAAGTHSLMVAGINVPVAVTVGMTATQLATAVVAAITANPNLPVSATSSAGAVTATAKNKGLTAADVDVRVNYAGTAGGQSSPAGITYSGISNQTGTQLSGGGTNPSTALATALANLGTRKFNIIVQPYNDATSRTTFQSYMNATAGRWAWNQMLYGAGIGCYRGTYSALTTFGTARNDPAMSTMGMNDAPEPTFVWAADIAGNVAISVRANPAQPLHDVPLGVLPPPLQSDIFAYGSDNQLLFDGVSTFKVEQGGQVYIQQLITEYQTNSQGAPDTSYLYANTRFQLDYVATDLLNFVNTTFIATRKILVSDATKVSVTVGSPIVTPSIVKAAIIARYLYLQSLGIVQNADTFIAGLVVQQVATGVLGVSWPGDLAEQLNNIAIQIAFSQ